MADDQAVAQPAPLFDMSKAQPIAAQPAQSAPLFDMSKATPIGASATQPSSTPTISAEPSLAQRVGAGIAQQAPQNPLDPAAVLSSAPGMVGSALDTITREIENYTPQGRAEHPILAHIGDVTSGLKELLFGGQAAGKPLGTQSGLVTNPVTQAMTLVPGADTAAAGAQEKITRGLRALRDAREAKAAEAATKGVTTANDAAFHDFQLAVPPSKSAPYTPTDFHAARPYLEEQHRLDTISSPEEVEKGVNKSLDKVETNIRGMVDALPPGTTIKTNPLGAVRQALGSNEDITFLERGLKDLERFKLGFERGGGVVDPPLTIADADRLRWRLNQEMKAVLKKNNYDIATAEATDPGFAAAQVASEALRNGVYDGLAENGFKGVDKLRSDEGSLIKIRNAAYNQIFKGEKPVAGTGAPSMARKIAAKTAKTVTTGAGAAAGGAIGGPVGAVGGAVAGGELGEAISNALGVNPLTRNQLIERSFSRTLYPPAPTPGDIAAAAEAEPATEAATANPNEGAAAVTPAPTEKVETPNPEKGASKVGGAVAAGALALAGATLRMSRPEVEEKKPEPVGAAPAEPVSSAKTAGGINALIGQAAAENRIPPSLLMSQARQESRLDPDAISRKGAVGLMQLMPKTAEALGVDPTIPEDNVRGGAAYMHQLHRRFGQWDKALAAYNWGPDKVHKVIEKYGDSWMEHVPSQTRNYIRTILKQRQK